MTDKKKVTKTKAVKEFKVITLKEIILKDSSPKIGTELTLSEELYNHFLKSKAVKLAK